MPGGKFAEDRHRFEIELDRGERSLRKGVEGTVRNARRTQGSRGSEGVHGQTDPYISSKVFSVRH